MAASTLLALLGVAVEQMTADPQLPIEPTIRIDPSTQVQHMPGTDAVCECARSDVPYTGGDCGWPFCAWKDHTNKEDT